MSPEFLAWGGFALAFAAIGATLLQIQNPKRVRSAKALLVIAALVVAVRVAYWAVTVQGPISIRLGVSSLVFVALVIAVVTGYWFAGHTVPVETLLNRGPDYTNPGSMQGHSVPAGLLKLNAFGLVPAWRATRLDFATSLKQSRRTTGAVSRLSKGLIVAQVALSLLLLVGAGLFIRTLHNLQRVNLGFNQEELLLFRLQPEQGGYKGERLMQFYQQLFARLDKLPGVRAATFEKVELIGADNYVNSILLPGETEMTATPHSTNRQMARENYFATMEIPLLRGRGFTAQDDQRAPQVGIVNQTFARKFFPNTDVLGQRVTFFSDNKRAVEIIGVVADTKYMSQREELKPLLYTPWRQEGEVIGDMYFALRTAGDPTALAATVRQVVREQDSNLPVTQVSTQTARAQATLGQERLMASS